MAKFVGIAWLAAASCPWVACSGQGPAAPPGPADPTVVDEQDATPRVVREAGATSTCTPGDTLPCTIDRGTFMGIHDCAEGTQTCHDDGSWGSCIEL